MFASLWAEYHLNLQSYEIYSYSMLRYNWLTCKGNPQNALRFDRVKALAILKLTFFSNCSLRINDLEKLIVVGFSSSFIIYLFYLFDFHLDNSSRKLSSAYLAFSALIKSNVALSVWDEKKAETSFVSWQSTSFFHHSMAYSNFAPPGDTKLDD